MSDAKHYSFRIQKFTPETMPFGRLVDYYAELQKMLGVSDNLHLTDIFESSHGNKFRVDFNHETELQKRIAELNEGTAPNAAKKAQDKLNAMLKADATSADFVDSMGQNVIVFPGKGLDAQSIIRIRDAATFVGELYHIAGTKDDAKIRLTTEAYGVVFCTTTRDIAKSLRDFLFEDIKVSGRGTWTRDGAGTWDIDDFAITDFTPVKKESLRQSIDRIRSARVVWPDDALRVVRDIEEKGAMIG